MRALESPGAALRKDRLRRPVGSEVTFHRNFAQASIHATLVGSDRCEAEALPCTAHRQCWHSVESCSPLALIRPDPFLRIVAKCFASPSDR